MGQGVAVPGMNGQAQKEGPPEGPGHPIRVSWAGNFLSARVAAFFLRQRAGPPASPGPGWKQPTHQPLALGQMVPFGRLKFPMVFCVGAESVAWGACVHTRCLCVGVCMYAQMLSCVSQWGVSSEAGRVDASCLCPQVLKGC